MNQQCYASSHKSKLNTISASYVRVGLMAVVVVLACSFMMPSMADTTPRWLLEFEKKCDAGSMKDCMNAAHSHALGKFRLKKTKKNKEKADFFIQRILQMGEQGCDNNSNLENCYLLGLMYFEGTAIIRDVPKSLTIVDKACKGGYKEACSWLEGTGAI